MKLLLSLIVGLLAEILQTLKAWLKGEAQIVCILALLYAIGFALTGVPGWFVVAVICALLHLVPIVGAPLGLLLALAVTFFADRTFWQVMGVLIAWVIVQSIEGFYLSPYILGKRTRIAPLAVFFGVALGGSIFGFFGILLAVPAMAVAMVIYRYLDRSRPSALK